MTEVPEHLIQRSRDRRVALGLLAPEEGGAGTPEVAAAVSANTPAVAGGAGAAASTAKVPVPIPDTGAPPPADPTPPWVTAANDRQRIPKWVMPILLFLPIWAFMYVGTLEDPTREEGLIYEGGKVYAENCAVCHGATGGGGAGPALTGGRVIERFASFEDQVEWVIKGTDGFQAEGRATYGDTGEPVDSGRVMPGFSEKLTAEEITLAILYERIELSGYGEELVLGEAVFDAFEHEEIVDDEDHVVEHWELDVTIDEIMSQFADLRSANAGDEVASE